MGMGAERKIVAQFDKDGDKRLNAAERREARAWLETPAGDGPGRRAADAAGRARGGGDATPARRGRR